MMEYILLALVLFVAFAASLMGIAFVRKVDLRYGLLDRPDDDRKKHSKATPTLGGIGIFFGFCVGVVFLYFLEPYLPFKPSYPSVSLWIAALVMLAAGVYDDIHNLGFKRKFVLQIAVAYMLLYSGFRINVEGLPFVGDEPFQQAMIAIPITLLWIVGVINAINLIDGLDGLAAGVSIIAFAYLALIFSFQGGIGIVLPALIMVGALSGFLIYNFNPAKIFMGDSGSLFLGVMLASYSLNGQLTLDPLLSFLTLVAVLGLPLLDVGFSILRRLVNGRAIFAPDDDHIHHRMMRLWSHRRAVLLLYAVATSFGTVAVLMSIASPTTGFLLFGLALSLSCIGLMRLKSVRHHYARPLLKGLSGSGAKGNHGGDGDGAIEHHSETLDRTTAPYEHVH